MEKFFRVFAGRHIIAILFTVMVMLLGLGTLYQIKRDTFPDVDFGRVVITTRYPGASPEDVELNVTNEIEEELKSVSNIDKITSYSMENISIITVEIDVNIENKDDIRDDIREAVRRVNDLPEEVTEAPLINEISSQSFPVLEVGIAGDIPYRDLREYARLFKKKLENITGVARVDEFWNLEREIKIEVFPDSIEKYQVPLQEISNAIRQRNVRSTGGSFESYTSQKNLVTLAQFDTPEKVSEVIVRTTFNGPSVKVGDLAQIVDTFEDPNIIARMNGVPAITFSVLKKEAADIIRTDNDIKNLIEKEQELAPDKIDILYANDISFYLKNRFNVVLSNGAIGLVLVLIILTIFLNLRTAFWVGLSIPVVLLGVIFLLPISGAYLDIIGLAAMIQVIGIIVDDGIIVGENIVRRRELGDDPLTAAARGTSEVFRPVLTTILTTFLAFAPMFFMEGVFGEFIVSIPLVISLAVFVSLFELVIALPAHLVPGLKNIKTSREKKKHWFDRIREIFKNVMKTVLKLRYIFILLSLLLLVGSLWYARSNMKFILFPDEAADQFSITAELPIGASIEKTADKVRLIENLILQLPKEELASFTTKIGTQGERQPGENAHWAIINIFLTPFAQRDRTANEIIAEMRPVTDTLSGFQNINYNVEAGGPPVGDPITIRVVGDEDDLRRQLTDSLITFLSTIEGVKDIDRNDKLGKEQIELIIDYDRMAELGLDVATLARTVRTAYDGDIVTTVRYGDEDVEFRVILEEESRLGPEYLDQLLIPNRQNRLITLSDVADYKTGRAPSTYYHYNRERTTTVTAGLEKDAKSPLQVTGEASAHFDLDRDWPGMRFVIGGEAEETAESFESLGIAFIIAVIGIYFILIILFDSFTQPFMVMVAIPFGVVAVIIAFAIHGEPPGFLAMMGLIGLMGVVVNDSLVMVDRINNLRSEDPDSPLVNIVSQGAADRLRAIIMTTLTTTAGLIPLAYGIGGSDPFIAPMALALGYGLLFATPLTLVLVPCLYIVREDIFRIFTWIGGLIKRPFGK